MKGKTVGKIVEWVEENNEHYPVFLFTTNDNVEIKSRCKVKIDNEILESSLESLYAFETVNKILLVPLPHEGIYISYDVENPNNFCAKWDVDPKYYLNPESNKNEEKETIIQLIGYYLALVVFLIVPFLGLFLPGMELMRYKNKYEYEHEKSALPKLILFSILIVLEIIYSITFIVLNYIIK